MMPMMPQPATKAHRRRRRPLPIPSYALLLLLFFGMYLIGPPTTTTLTVGAEEIVATSEWTKLKPDDTVPAGLHVKIDLSTGEKWAKLVDDDDNDNDDQGKQGAAVPPAVAVDEVVVGSDGSVSSAASAASGGGGGGGGKTATAVAVTPSSSSASPDEDENDEDTGKDQDGAEKSQFDYEMMHRALSKLPEDEIERMGGLPALPEGSNDISGKTISPEERRAFEERMAEIWTRRQEEIRSMQEEFMADLPRMLLQRIRFVREEYLNDPIGHRAEITEKRQNGRGYQDYQSDGTDDDADEAVVSDIVEVLNDVEYHVSDVDHARDFHTLGGWPVVVSLLSDAVHFPPDSAPTHDALDSHHNETTDADRDLVYEIQASAAWVIGTAVKNHDEFHGWALEDVAGGADDASHPRPDDGPVTVISLLLSNLRDHQIAEGATTARRSSKSASSLSRRQRTLYALGSLLRGNPAARRHFVDLDGPAVLGTDLSELLLLGGGGGADGNAGDAAAPEGISVADVKFASKVLALGDDLITDVLLHGGGGGATNDGDAEVGDDDDSVRLISSLTTEPWCQASLHLTKPLSGVTSVPIRERALNAVRTMVPYCNFGEEGRRVVELVGAELRGGSGGGTAAGKQQQQPQSAFMELDPSYRAELVGLVDSLLKEME